MKALEISQGELARRIGTKQPTIWKILHGETQNPRHLRQIARELNTTAAYLAGDTDDPESELPQELLTAEERQWVELLRVARPQDRSAIVHLTRTAAAAAAAVTAEPVHAG